MKIYDENTKKEIQNPDLTKGFLYEGIIVIGRTEPEVVVMPGTVTEERPDGLREYIPAQDIVEECKFYHKYADGEGGDAVTWASMEAAISANASNVTDVQVALAEVYEMILGGN